MKENLELFLDLYELTMAEVYFRYKPDTLATFELFVRELPKSRNWLLVAGLSDILDFVMNLKFEDKAIDYLKERKIFSQDFLNYLKNFRFRGDIWALPEGEICFANEPILQVEANIIEAQILESFLLNTINLQTSIASKASRVVIVAKEKTLYDFSLRRTQGKDAGLKVSRCAYIAGFSGTSNVLAGLTYGIPIVGTMAHSFVMSFKTELESFFAYSSCFPYKTILLVDTYNTLNGIQNAIKVAKELKRKGFNLVGIRLDSGDIVYWAKRARFMLDKAGLNFVKILASGNLDEYKIADILKEDPPIDSFGVGTHMGTSSDSPYLDVIYKLTQVGYDKKRLLPTMKLSEGKLTYPGRKQIFRVVDKSGFYVKDILALEKERLKGRPLLIKVVDKGRLLYNSPSLEKIKEYAKENLSYLPSIYKDIHSKVEYPLIISKALGDLTKKISKRLTKESQR
ncbi:MAG: nicotinate phosphoribosyltransferase [Candidatus Omnitrophica bacterium]|nr:nicotinate phosphoribosyltransferase [Candidatus Omnitrophota bacterium]